MKRRSSTFVPTFSGFSSIALRTDATCSMPTLDTNAATILFGAVAAPDTSISSGKRSLCFSAGIDLSAARECVSSLLGCHANQQLEWHLRLSKLSRQQQMVSRRTHAGAICSLLTDRAALQRSDPRSGCLP